MAPVDSVGYPQLIDDSATFDIIGLDVELIKSLLASGQERTTLCRQLDVLPS